MLSKKTSAWKRRVEKLVEDNLRLVHFVSKRTYPYANQDLREELASVGNLYLYKAAQSYDPDFGTAFSTYAYTVIQRAMIAFVAINQRQGMSRGKHEHQVVSLSSHSITIDSPLENIIAEESAERVEDFFDGKVASKYLEQLSEREQAVIRLRYFDGLCLEKSSERLGISKERVRQIQERCLAKLRLMFIADEEDT
jgi:RNA polymerase sigma factor (sigma-70 family)